jgi:hypothetical protein
MTDDKQTETTRKRMTWNFHGEPVTEDSKKKKENEQQKNHRKDNKQN